MKFLKVFCKVAAVLALLLLVLRCVDAFYPLWTTRMLNEWFAFGPSAMMSVARYLLMFVFMFALMVSAPRSSQLRIPAFIGMVAALYSIAINLNLVYALGDHRLGYILSYYTIVRTTLIQAMLFASFIWISTKLTSALAKFFSFLMAVVGPGINLVWSMLYIKMESWFPTPDTMQTSLFSLLIVMLILAIDFGFYLSFGSKANKLSK